LRFVRCVVGCDLPETFLAAICLKHSWLHFARYALGCVLPEIWLRFDRCVVGCDLPETFLAAICLKHYWLRFARYALGCVLPKICPDTMTDVTAHTGQAPTMAPPVRSNDQSLPRIGWVQTGYLKFSAKGTKREVFGMPIPGSLITADLREASYYQEYLANVVKHRWFLGGEPARKPNPTAQKVRINILQYLIHLRMCKDVPTKMMKMFLLVVGDKILIIARFCSLWHRMYDTVMQDLGIPIQGQLLHSVP
nr:hypothetical protein [Tanacetum cinerariifolium]